MARLIDANALKEAISEIPIGVSMYATSAESKAVCKFAARVYGLIDDAPTIGGWVSADKRPPKQGRYLVWGLTQIVPDHNDEPNGYWQTKIAQWFDRTGWDCKVKFWQMLPEPPKEEDG